MYVRVVVVGVRVVVGLVVASDPGCSLFLLKPPAQPTLLAAAPSRDMRLYRLLPPPITPGITVYMLRSYAAAAAEGCAVDVDAAARMFCVMRG